MVHNTQETENQESPELRLWRAVIASTVDEWVHGPMTKKREAEQYLFDDDHDYRTVCSSAGIDPENLRTRLMKIRARQSAETLAAASRN
ncbi:MAG TPA: hypothetical protein VNI36_02910 [Candidatus Dormibacteraeota bacterium]|nr:hypothetical protein [Candidatus Dormibacteraeota bacterium]